MMQSEFTKMTGMYVTASHYAEIEKRYVESGMNKQDFCKAYKANKDGMAEAIAQEAGMSEWVDKLTWKEKYEELDRNYDRMQEQAREKHKALFNAKTELEGRLDEVQRALDAVNTQNVEMENQLKAKDQEIMMLKAKLYDMMMKGVA